MEKSKHSNDALTLKAVEDKYRIGVVKFMETRKRNVFDTQNNKPGTF